MKRACWVCDGDGLEGCLECDKRKETMTCQNAQVALPFRDHAQMTIFDLIAKKDADTSLSFATALDSAAGCASIQHRRGMRREER